MFIDIPYYSGSILSGNWLKTAVDLDV